MRNIGQVRVLGLIRAISWGDNLKVLALSSICLGWVKKKAKSACLIFWLPMPIKENL